MNLSPYERAILLRWALKNAADSNASLAKQYTVNPKTVAKWRARESMLDRRSGPPLGTGRSLTPDEEYVAAAFRRLFRLPLDDCLQVFIQLMPKLTRSSLYRCYRRQRIGKQYDLGGRKRELIRYSRFRQIGAFVGDLVPLRLGDVYHYYLIFVDTVSRFVVAKGVDRWKRESIIDGFDSFVSSVPYRVECLFANIEGDLFAFRPFPDEVRPNPFDHLQKVHRIKTGFLSLGGVGPHAVLESAVGRYVADRYLADDSSDLQSFIDGIVRRFNSKTKLRALGWLSPVECVEAQLKSAR